MLGLNKILLIGTVGRTPETRYIGSGASFSRFSVATSETETQAGGRVVEHTEWHEVVTFRGLSDFAARYLKKGDLVYVEGKMKSRYVSDGQGAGHRIFEVLADRLQILSRSKANSESPMPDETSLQDPDENGIKIGAGLPGFDIENIPGNLKGDGDSLPF